MTENNVTDTEKRDAAVREFVARLGERLRIATAERDRAHRILDALRTPNDYMVQIIFDAIYGRNAGSEDAVNALRAILKEAEEVVGE